MKRIRLGPEMRVSLPLLLTLLAMSCESSDLVDPERLGDGVFTLTTPGVQVTGAMVDLSGVADVILTDGNVILRQSGDRLRAVLLLHDAGELDFGIRMASGTQRPTGVVLAVIGVNDEMLSPVSDFRLEFDR